MLICLHDRPHNLASLNAFFCDQTVSNAQKKRESNRHHLVKVSPNLSNFESVNSAYGQQALNASKDGARIVRAQELYCNIEEIGPLGRKVVGEDFLEGRNELSADLRGGRSEDRNEAVTERCFLFFGYGFGLGVVFGRGPSFRDTILEVDDS